MNNPPIIKPKILDFAQKAMKSPAGRIVGLSPLGKAATFAAAGLAANQTFGGIGGLMEKHQKKKRRDIKEDAVLGRSGALVASIGALSGMDPVIKGSQPDEIQNELNTLTAELSSLPKKKKKKSKEVKKDETKEFDDAKEFKKWVSKNTKTDKETGAVSFIQPVTGEEIAIESSPETNVLLYEVFKEQTGRTGEAAEAIVNMDTESLGQLQENPYKTSTKAGFITDLKLLRGQDVNPGKATRGQNMAVTGGKLGGALAGGVVGFKTHPYLTPLGVYAGWKGGGGLMKDLAGYPEGQESGKTPRAEEYAEAIAGTMPIDYNDPGQTTTRYQSTKDAVRMGYEDEQAAEATQLAFRKAGSNDSYELTPVPLTPLEVQTMSEAGYEFAPPTYVDELFYRQAVLSGHGASLSGPNALEVQEARLNNELTLSKIAKNYADIEEGAGVSPLMHKKAFKIELPGMYSTASNDRLKYNVRLLESDKGESRFTADLDIAPIMSEIYRAEKYTQETQGEIEEVRNLLGPDTVGLAQRANDIVRTINALGGGSRGIDIEIEFETDRNGDEILDDFGQPILTEESQRVAAEILSRWAKRFTAQNITVLLGESNRTISDADRKRADDIVNILGTTTDLTSAWIALDELLKIFQKPSDNANTALQALYAQAEQSGYLDQVIEAEKSLSTEIERGGSKLSVPRSSRLQMQEVNRSDIPEDAVIRTINLAGGS